MKHAEAEDAMTAPEPSMLVQEIAPRKFSLTVTVGGQVFDCGSYISRAEATQAGKLFLERKQGEEAGRRKRPRKKAP
jgi:hypothetical protein